MRHTSLPPNLAPSGDNGHPQNGCNYSHECPDGEWCSEVMVMPDYWGQCFTQGGLQDPCKRRVACKECYYCERVRGDPNENGQCIPIPNHPPPPPPGLPSEAEKRNNCHHSGYHRTSFECQGGTLGCHNDSSTYCSRPTPTPHVGRMETHTCTSNGRTWKTFECSGGTYGCHTNAPKYCYSYNYNY
ncbi:hypothetical protein TL16_g05314 [Triparma laevis f. inornata]|uniref:Uncharacterized protein n=1 Tax=Triparma laevis f. inornata TaxID=1714386 RepID=A0A9W7E9L2_9STRA|nr:hypothetical protein TL16_g05314 [Triparma laevis f. inornata]